MNETEFDTGFAGSRLASFRRRLLRWYADHRRDLPWRKTRDAYRVWISEIMLQQTTVSAVVPYFERFLQQFPTVAELAAAPEEEVLRLWEGLGYYSRARNIHRTAAIIVDEHGGDFPETVDELQKLPGIGRYTAGAIASFAFGKPAAIVEANTLRLYCRLLGYDGDPRSSVGQRLLWRFAGRLVPEKSPGDFNHALMDLGATLCRPTEPSCGECPVRRDCRAFAEKRVDEIPVPAKRTEITDVTAAAIAVWKNGRVLLRRCEPGERWAGLWDFPRLELDATGKTTKSIQADSNRGAAPADTAEIRRTVESHVRNSTGIEAEVDRFLDEIRHSVTRFRIRLLCYSGRHCTGTLKRSAGLRWISPRGLKEVPLSVSGRKLAQLLLESR